MLSKNKVITSLLASTLLLSACGDNSAGDTDTATETNEGNGSSEVTKIEITWRGTGDQDNVRRYLEEVEEGFEAENEDIDIVLTPITASEGDYFSKAALSMQSPETAPEIINEDTFMLSSDANAGYLKNLDEYLADWDEWDKFIENIKEGVTGEDGSIYGIPGTTDSRGIWYNKDVFREAGLPEDWQPETWEEVIETAETVKESNPEVVPFAMNVAKVNGEATAMQTFEMLLYGTGEALYDQETEKWNVNGEGILDSLNFINEIMNERNLGPSLAVAINQSFGSVINQEMLPNGEVGMVLEGNWNIGNYLEGGAAPLENPQETLGFAKMPTQNGQEPGFVTMAGGWSWAIPEQSQHHDESWRVIEYMSSMESQTRRSNLEGTLTVREDSAQTEEYLERPLVEPATEALENAQFRPKSDVYPNVSVVIQDIVEAVATGSQTPDEAAENYKESVIEVVGEENTY